MSPEHHGLLTPVRVARSQEWLQSNQRKLKSALQAEQARAADAHRLAAEHSAELVRFSVRSKLCAPLPRAAEREATQHTRTTGRRLTTTPPLYQTAGAAAGRACQSPGALAYTPASPRGRALKKQRANSRRLRQITFCVETKP